MKVIVILQARTASTRLPGKALLPVAGYPSAALAALRAANRGHELLVATSDHSSDDELAQTFRSYGIKVFRGALDDVLGRYYCATLDLPGDCIVIRLTGDNVLPDGEFVEQLTSAFLKAHCEYLSVSSPQSRLPYGLGGEVFSVDTLRKTHAAASSAYDREHVGPWMARNCSATSYSPLGPELPDYSHLRCTIDDEQDYQRILRLFSSIDDPVAIGWLALTQKLSTLPGEPAYRVINNRVHSAMTLGTVQLGMEYGVVNGTGKPRRSDAIAIVRHAIAHGVTALDTARSYGDSEQILGEALSGAWGSRVEVITKLDTLTALRPDASAEQVRAAVDQSVSSSCRALGTTGLTTLLLHRWHHHDAWRGEAWQRLLELRDSGKITRLGASIYEPAEALAALNDPDIQHLQLPLNVIDSRWKAHGIDRELVQRPDVVVHARSAFLQGVLLHPADRWPVSHSYANSCLQALQTLAQKFDRESVADLCLAYVRSQSWITSVVVGCEIMSQLEENLGLFRLPNLTAEQCEEIERSLPVAPDDLLNPSRWKLAHA
ncbi:MAG: aldo/keto reductase [Candidatus Sulfotelmatobacter sp.]|jgi:spore coat polysaccharide biosynthesis protein SpsF (cytidylyltransferase family)/aryl-alcohol dehydrogenase-like predicted oxidoreductase